MTDGGWDPGVASHRALRGVRRALERHPAVDRVTGFAEGEHTRVVAELSPARLDASVDATAPTLTVRWLAGETAADPPSFSFHYSDDHGDLGWHHAPNPHVDGRGHYQERLDGEAYDYEPHSFDSTQPTRVVWAVVALVEDRLDAWPDRRRTP